MKMNICPHCGHKTEELICEKCFEETRVADANTNIHYLRRSLRLAVIVNNYHFIIKRANAVLAIKPQDYKATYYLAYAQNMQNDNLAYNIFLTTSFQHSDEEIEEVIYHMIRYITNNQKLIIKTFINNNINNLYKREQFISILNHFNDDATFNDEEFLKMNDEKAYESELRSTLFPMVKIKEIKTIKKVAKGALISIITGIIIECLIWLILLPNLKTEIIPYVAIYSYIFPSILITYGIIRFLFKKGNFLVFILLLILVIIITTYIPLLSYEKNFIDHAIYVIKSPVEFFNNIWERITI